MRTTVTLDDALLARAEQLCGDLERSALLKEALRALVQRESAKRLAPWVAANPHWSRFPAVRLCRCPLVGLCPVEPLPAVDPGRSLDRRGPGARVGGMHS